MRVILLKKLLGRVLNPDNKWISNNRKITNYTIIYLYESKTTTFKRGWHGV